MSSASTSSCASGESPGTQREVPVLAVALWCGAAAAALVYLWPAFQSLADAYGTYDDYAHGFIVPLVSLWAAYHSAPLLRARFPSASWLGLPVVGAGILLVIYATWYGEAMHPGGLGVEFLQAAGVIACTWGLGLCALGPRGLLVLAFPLAFLVFAVPFPESWTIRITFPQRQFVTAIAGNVLELLRVPVYREGSLLHLAGMSLGVEDACSGIRSFWTLMASSVAIAYLMGCRAGAVIGVGLVSIPLAVVQNLLRVVITALCVHAGAVQWAGGWRHELIGWLTFAVAALGAVLLANRWAPDPASTPGDGEAAGTRIPDRPRSVVLPVVLVLLFGAGAVTATHIGRHYDMAAYTTLPVEDGRTKLDALPERIGPYRKGHAIEIPANQLEMLSPTDFWVGSYRRGGGTPVLAILMYWDPRRIRPNPTGVDGPHSPDICLPAFGWRRVEGTREALDLPGLASENASARLFERMGTTKLVVYWWRTAGDPRDRYIAASLRRRWATLVESWKNPGVTIGRQYSVIIAADVLGDPARARTELVDFAQELHAALEPFGFSPDALPAGGMEQSVIDRKAERWGAP